MPSFLRTIAVVALLAITAPPARAQAPAMKPTTLPDSTKRGAEQTIAIGYTSSGYTIADSSVKERTDNFAYDLRAGRVHLGVEGKSVAYTVPSRNINGFVPTALTFDVMVHPGDTLTFVARLRSQPNGLDSAQVSALGVSGGALVDLQSSSFGQTAMTGAHAVVTFPLGDLSFALRGGLEVETRPTTTAPVYWRGTTVLGGATLSTPIGASKLSGSLDLSTSSSDSLGGKNLFPGGGEFGSHIDLHVPLDNPFNPDGDDLTTDWAFRWTNPTNATRSDQPNRRVPIGPMRQFTGSLTIPIGDGSAQATFNYLSTNSSESYTVGKGKALATASTTSSSHASILTLEGSIPVIGGVELQPQVGFATGSSDLATSGVARRRGRSGTGTAAQATNTKAAVSGGWVGLTLSFSF